MQNEAVRLAPPFVLCSKPWMSDNCKEACGLCEQGCVDGNTYCQAWAAIGECSYK
jgi:hypothetical protein